MNQTVTPPQVDWRALAQAGGHLAVLCGTATLALWSWFHHWPWALTIALVFLHGMASATFANAMHELGHGTVFRTKAGNWIFLRIFSFLGWINFEMFNASHQRHHR